MSTRMISPPAPREGVRGSAPGIHRQADGSVHLVGFDAISTYARRKYPLHGDTGKPAPAATPRALPDRLTSYALLAASDAHGVRMERVLGAGKDARTIDARFSATVLLLGAGLSLSAASGALGRTHAAALNARRRVSDRIETDPRFAERHERARETFQLLTNP